MNTLKSLLAWLVLCCVLHAGHAAGKPNIVFILADDIGYGDPGCYNPKSKIATPNIDRLAREGLRFTNAHAPGPLCHPSRYRLMTGRYPFRTDVSLWPKQPLIEKGRVTIASLLRDEGYHTAMVGKWHLGFREDGYDHPLRGGPVDCGFDSFFGRRASTDIPPYCYIRGDGAVTPPTGHTAAHHSEGWSPSQGAFWREGGIAPGLELKDVLPRFTDEACAVINAQADKKPNVRRPLMLYLAFTAPHTPWLPAAEFAGKSGAGMYGDFVMMVDAQIGRVLAALEKAGMTQDTLLIVTRHWSPVTRHFVAYDRNGNVTALVNAADGSISARYEYGPFGEPIRATGFQCKANPFRWSTKYWDDETDLVYYGYRYYSPSLGKWISRDPIGEEGGVNLYEFAGNSPVVLFDISGTTTGTIAEQPATAGVAGTIVSYSAQGLSLYWRVQGAVDTFNMVQEAIAMLDDGSLSADEFAELCAMTRDVLAQRLAGRLASRLAKEYLAVQSLEKGPYGRAGGHHIHSQAAFRGHVSYDPKKGLSVSEAYMTKRGWKHDSATAKQRELFAELRRSGRPNTLEEQSRIGY
jgi:RHS repeat-associated protein